MEYPNNFDVPSFPAGKTVAFSRSMAIWISIVFFLIVVACGFVLFGIHQKKNYPFLISIDPFTDEWSVVAYPQEKKEIVPQYQIIQEKLVRDYVTNWFSISGNQAANESRWHQCSFEECKHSEQFNPYNLNCALSCKSSSELFKSFSEKVLPEYRARVEQGAEKWTVGQMLITPPNKTEISETYGNWQVIVNITSNISGNFKVLGFITLKRNVDEYPSTFGYYVQDFNTYRITNE